MFTSVMKNKADEQSDCGGNKGINSSDLSLSDQFQSIPDVSTNVLLVPSLKVLFLTKVQACTSWMILSSLIYLLPSTLLLNVCPLIPCSTGHKDFSMLFFCFRLFLKHLSPKLFLPPQGVVFSKGIASLHPQPSILG